MDAFIALRTPVTRGAQVLWWVCLCIFVCLSLGEDISVSVLAECRRAMDVWDHGWRLYCKFYLQNYIHVVKCFKLSKSSIYDDRTSVTSHVHFLTAEPTWIIPRWPRLNKVRACPDDMSITRLMRQFNRHGHGWPLFRSVNKQRSIADTIGNLQLVRRQTKDAMFSEKGWWRWHTHTRNTPELHVRSLPTFYFMLPIVVPQGGSLLSTIALFYSSFNPSFIAATQ